MDSGQEASQCCTEILLSFRNASAVKLIGHKPVNKAILLDSARFTVT